MDILFYLFFIKSYIKKEFYGMVFIIGLFNYLV